MTGCRKHGLVKFLMDFSQETFINITNQPADVCYQANANFIGPTAVDFSMLPVETRISDKERKLLNGWKKQDLGNYYKSLKSNYY